LLRSRNSGIRAKIAKAIRVKKEENTMENILRKRPIPEYYDTMYLDGYTPYEILYAVRKKMHREYLEREEVKMRAK
jgi:hypothetical protein